MDLSGSNFGGKICEICHHTGEVALLALATFGHVWWDTLETIPLNYVLATELNSDCTCTVIVNNDLSTYDLQPVGRFKNLAP